MADASDDASDSDSNAPAIQGKSQPESIPKLIQNVNLSEK